MIDPLSLYSYGSLVDKWSWHTGGLFLEQIIRRKLLASIPRIDFSCVYIEGGELIGPLLVQELKKLFGTVINYNIDDPYGNRDGLRWRLYRQAVPFYDLVVVLRECNVPEARANGATKVMRVFMSADELAHSPQQITEVDDRRFSSGVAFVGTWMPERGPFLARLAALNVPLSIYGDRWQRAPEWPVLQPFWRGSGIYDDQEYAKVIQCAKVSLGLLSKGNRDLSTTRSFEIPLLGGVLCAERTTEHLDLYKEDEEAVFWDSPEECAEKCFQLLQHPECRKSIASKGQKRCIRNGTTNQIILSKILHAAHNKTFHSRIQTNQFVNSFS
ncbi:MAG TPA: glycosyltransferase [Candidatus Saccharimonadales bacterium]|nr:glycosyltransferase [Candidatus Saccharimonadales bacterium]